MALSAELFRSPLQLPGGPEDQRRSFHQRLPITSRRVNDTNAVNPDQGKDLDIRDQRQEQDTR